MYLVHLLQGKGYPVTSIFEKLVKPINTLRFDEFIREEENKVLKEAELEKQTLNEFSFATDASYDLLVDGPAIRPERPLNVPELSLNGLLGYVTSSDEDADEDHQYVEKTAEGAAHLPKHNHFNQSMKYIENYYKKQEQQQEHQQVSIVTENQQNSRYTSIQTGTPSSVHSPIMADNNSQ